MDNSIENVTLYAVFVNDVLKNYEDKKDQYKGLFNLADGYDISHPFNKVPMKVYNDMCNWLEKELGKFNLIKVGRTIGETVFNGLVDAGILKGKPSPLQVVEALAKATSEMIQDPQKRGWVILASTPNSITIQRTQTFHRILQLGLIDGLVRKTGVLGVKVDFSKSITEGAEFDEYLISWIS